MYHLWKTWQGRWEDREVCCACIEKSALQFEEQFPLLLVVTYI
jgi:hypothetical protein